MYSVSFLGGETTGSVGKRNINPVTQEFSRIQTPEGDTVNFRGREYGEDKKSSSFLSNLFGVAAFAALVIGGLGCAHKYDVVGKLKDGKFKDFMRKSDKITEPCHKWCAKAKEFGVKYYNKIKDFFKKN